MTTLAELTDGAHKRSFMNIAAELIRFGRKSDCKFVTLLIRFGKKFLVERLKSIMVKCYCFQPNLALALIFLASHSSLDSSYF